jgi:hypothetical protein
MARHLISSLLLARADLPVMNPPQKAANINIQIAEKMSRMIYSPCPQLHLAYSNQALH